MDIDSPMVWTRHDPTQGLLPKAVYFSHNLMVRMPDCHSLNMAVVGLQSGSPTYTCGFAWCTWGIVSSIPFPCLFLRETFVHTRYPMVSLVPRPSPSFSSLAGQLTVLQATRSLTTSDGKLGEGLGTRLHHGINQHTLRFNVHCWSAIIIIYYI